VKPSLLCTDADPDEAVGILRLPRTGRSDIVFLPFSDVEESNLIVNRTCSCVPQLPPVATVGASIRRSRAGDTCLLVNSAGVWILGLPLSLTLRTGLGSAPAR